MYFEISVKSSILSNFTTYRLIRQWIQLDKGFVDIATVDAAKNSSCCYIIIMMIN